MVDRCDDADQHRLDAALRVEVCARLNHTHTRFFDGRSDRCVQWLHRLLLRSARGQRDRDQSRSRFTHAGWLRSEVDKRDPSRIRFPRELHRKRFSSGWI